jgi:hypothetical protein
MTQRVQIPAYTTDWMRGDRYGEVIKTTMMPYAKLTAHVLGNHRPGRGRKVEIAHVLLDKSGHTVRVVLADCEVVPSS